MWRRKQVIQVFRQANRDLSYIKMIYGIYPAMGNNTTRLYFPLCILNLSQDNAIFPRLVVTIGLGS